MFKNALVLSALLGVCVLACRKTSAQDAASQTFAANPNHAGSLPSEQNLPSLERDLRSRMKQIIAAQLALTEAQEKKFWPLYGQYEAELARISDKKVALIREYSQKDDMDSYFRARAAIDKSIMEVNLNYVARFR
jgi:Spy/CpxP family protein refolding chaperone